MYIKNCESADDMKKKMYFESLKYRKEKVDGLLYYKIIKNIYAAWKYLKNLEYTKCVKFFFHHIIIIIISKNLVGR